MQVLAFPSNFRASPSECHCEVRTVWRRCRCRFDVVAKWNGIDLLMLGASEVEAVDPASPTLRHYGGASSGAT